MGFGGSILVVGSGGEMRVGGVVVVVVGGGLGV